MPVVELFNLYYFLYIFIALGVTILSVKFLKNKSDRFRHYFIFGLIIFNLAIHFLKILIFPYTLIDSVSIWTKVSFENICAVSVLIFPFLYFIKNKTLKDYMVMVGMASGILTFIFPLDAMSTMFNGYISIGVRSAFMLETIRFYTAHFILFLVPFLMMHFKMHELSIRRAYRQPFILLVVLLMIFLNELFVTAVGWVPKEELFNPSRRNPSYIFGSKSEFSGIGMIIGFLVPSIFMVTHPIYGFTFYIPVLWLVLPVIVYGGLIALIMCFIYDKDDTILFFTEKFRLREQNAHESNKV